METEQLKVGDWIIITKSTTSNRVGRVGKVKFFDPDDSRNFNFKNFTKSDAHWSSNWCFGDDGEEYRILAEEEAMIWKLAN